MRVVYLEHTDKTEEPAEIIITPFPCQLKSTNYNPYYGDNMISNLFIHFDILI